jgi:REP element-mobilizing transposase RayT
MPSPIYTPENCTPAYQLRWSLALFAKTALPSPDQWLDDLSTAVERDGVRILEYTFKAPNVCLLLVSTMPPVSPSRVVWSVKGRLQHLLTSSQPDTFRRNFSLTSVGDAKSDVVENYVASQLHGQPTLDVRNRKLLETFQLQFPEVRLDELAFTAHGRYLYNLHVVLVHDGRWQEVREVQLVRSRDMILSVAKKHEHRLSRVGLLGNHIHLTMRCSADVSPEDVALRYLNNFAFAHDMQRVFQFGYYVGTIGPYDMDSVRRGLQPEIARSTGTGPVEAVDEQRVLAGQSVNHRHLAGGAC